MYVEVQPCISIWTWVFVSMAAKCMHALSYLSCSQFLHLPYGGGILPAPTPGYSNLTISPHLGLAVKLRKSPSRSFSQHRFLQDFFFSQSYAYT